MSRDVSTGPRLIVGPTANYPNCPSESIILKFQTLGQWIRSLVPPTMFPQFWLSTSDETWQFRVWTAELKTSLAETFHSVNAHWLRTSKSSFILCPIGVWTGPDPMFMKILKNSRWFRPQQSAGSWFWSESNRDRNPTARRRRNHGEIFRCHEQGTEQCSTSRCGAATKYGCPVAEHGHRSVPSVANVKWTVAKCYHVLISGTVVGNRRPRWLSCEILRFNDHYNCPLLSKSTIIDWNWNELTNVPRSQSVNFYIVPFSHNNRPQIEWF